MNIPENLRYTSTHEWVRFDGSQAFVGITDYAQSNLGDIVFVELPEIGAHLEVAAEAGTIESVKAVSPIYSPAAGSVVRTNAELEGAPEKVNADPYESWFFVLEVSDPHAADSLLDAEAYRKICE
ncbi:MAG: glycine cleavage system protein GcvH [Thermoguttaceae bacterium]|nr:glycine cleavage system protein GcvH [Thermoguttaceae bacterium]